MSNKYRKIIQDKKGPVYFQKNKIALDKLKLDRPLPVNEKVRKKT